MTGSKGSEPGHTDETACETTANASQRLLASCQMRLRNRVGWHWPAMAGNGAGDGNRKYRSGVTNHLISKCYEVARAARAIFV